MRDVHEGWSDPATMKDHDMMVAKALVEVQRALRLIAERLESGGSGEVSAQVGRVNEAVRVIADAHVAGALEDALQHARPIRRLDD